MCGIAGIVSARADAGGGAATLERGLRGMHDAVAHRGPDGWGLTTFSGTGVSDYRPDRPAQTTPRAFGGTALLAHRRLAILDLSSAGHQPMSRHGRLWITYNGEIYNFRELRAELEAQGERFVSQSDTEVLLALFAREGVAGLSRLRGMFAFALWDERDATLWLVRDRFGIKPLYWARGDSGTIVFASEIRAVLASGLVDAAPHPAADAIFLRRGSIPAPLTYFAAVQALPPGCYARCRSGSLDVEPYWLLRDGLEGPETHTSAADAAERFYAALVDSVGDHLVSDVPVGLFLSGGIDSALVAAALRERHAGDVRSFTLAFPGTGWDEAPAARHTARHFGTTHTERAVTHEMFTQALDGFFNAMDQPTVDGMNTYLVANAARDAGIKVALSGVGGDELLGGYPSFVRVPRLHALAQRLDRLGVAAGAAALARGLPARWAGKASEAIAAGPEVSSAWQAYRALFTERELTALLGAGAVRRAARLDEDEAALRDPFWEIARLEMSRFLVPQLLRDADVFTMCRALELRTPLVDHRLLAAVRACGRWPVPRGATPKSALARALGPRLPAGLAAQPKRGFTLPFEQWLHVGIADGAAARSGGLDLRPAFERPAAAAVRDAYAGGRVHWSKVWALYVLHRFKTDIAPSWISRSSSSTTTADRGFQPA